MALHHPALRPPGPSGHPQASDLRKDHPVESLQDHLDRCRPRPCKHFSPKVRVGRVCIQLVHVTDGELVN
jgi:hypothetical protein